MAKQHIRRRIQPHGTIANAAHTLFEHAAKNEDGRYLYRMAALVMEAFAFEGYVNVIGPKVLGKTWNEKQPTKEKIKAVLKGIDPKVDFGKRPYQTLIELFVFRDALAHPKAETIVKTKTLFGSAPKKIGYVLSQSEEFYQDDETIERVRSDLDAVVKSTWKDEWGFHPYDSGSQMSVIKEDAAK